MNRYRSTKFHACNASTLCITRAENSNLTYGDRVNALISYETIVCSVEAEDDDNYRTIHLYPHWNCTPTTTRQVCRFISEQTGWNVTAANIKALLKMVEPIEGVKMVHVGIRTLLEYEGYNTALKCATTYQGINDGMGYNCAYHIVD